MLTLHHSHHFGLPHTTHSSHKLELSPVVSENDELIQAIETAHDDDNWQLTGTPDVQQLDEFWTGVTEDLEKDPEWFTFADD